MQLILLLVAGVLAFGSVPAPASAAETAIEVPNEGVTSQGPKLRSDDSEAIPEPNDSTQLESGQRARAVFRNGCIRFPGGAVTIRLTARGRVLYRVVPSRFFDVTMRVTYLGLRSFFVDRFFAGGTESIRIQGPAGPRAVEVRIAGFRGSTGCFSFSAVP